MKSNEKYKVTQISIMALAAVSALINTKEVVKSTLTLDERIDNVLGDQSTIDDIKAFIKGEVSAFASALAIMVSVLLFADTAAEYKTNVGGGIIGN